MRQALAKLKSFSVEPPATAKGRVLLRHAQLADEDKSLVLTSSGQRLDYENIEKGHDHHLGDGQAAATTTR